MGPALPEPVPRMDIFLAAFDDVPDPRADNARHDLCELLVVAFVALLCGATSCAGMAAFGRARDHVFRGSVKLRHRVPSHDTDPTVFRVIDPKTLDAAFGRVLAPDRGPARRARQWPECAGQSARIRMLVSPLSRAVAPDAGLGGRRP